MGGRDRGTATEELLAHSGWLRKLAMRLVGDADVADDLVQETWIAAARRAPVSSHSIRPWLAKVLRDAFRMHVRGEGRRSAREQVAAVLADEVPTPEMLVARAEAQRLVVDLILRLEEPYRGVVLLHFCEGVSLADIARSHGVPAATVRWRLRVAIEQLRGWLDRSDDRKRWAVTLLALPKGVLVAQKATKIAVALVVLFLLVGGGIFMLVRYDRDDDAGAKVGGGAAAASAGGDAAWRANDSESRLPTWLAQRDLEAGRIAGRVTTLEGAPVKGASVELANLASVGGLVDPPRRTTNGAGEFDFGSQPAMSYAVHASAPGMTGASRTVDLRNPIARPRPDRLQLKLGPCDDAMFGTVRDASGGEIAGARITWLLAGSPADDRHVAGASVETSATGEYELCVAGGRAGAAVEVSADGYGAIGLRTQVWGRERYDFALVPEAVVVGRVIREDTGKPVAQAYVSLGPGQWGVERPAPRTAFSGADGRFRIAGVAPGAHLIGAIGDGLATARETPIVVEAGETTHEIEIVLETRSTVRGVVTDGRNPVPGAVVVARTNEPGRASGDAVSQKDGSFVLDRVPRGQVRFVARPYEVVRPRSFLVDRPSHEGVAIEVDALGAIVGQVRRHDRPVEGALIEMRGPNSHELEPIWSGADGRFEARGLRPGRWIVFAGSLREGAFGRYAKDIELERGETVEVTVDMVYGAAISGVVVDQDGAPVPAVTVMFQHGGTDDVGFATTSTDGSFRAAQMSGGGAYRVTVRSRDAPSGAMRPASGRDFPPVILADGTSEVTGVVLAVRLDRLSIAGRVVDESGVPVADARVAAVMTQSGVEPQFPRWRQQISTTTDIDGQFLLGDLSAGTYALQARSSSGVETIASGIAAGRTDVSLVLPSPGRVEGTLAGFREAPRVFATRQDARALDVPAPALVSGSSFVIASLGPGTYTVSAQTGSEAATARIEVAPGATSHVALTSPGSGSVTGRVRDFESGAPVEGMTCFAHARVGTTRTGGPVGDGETTARDGSFDLAAVPAGDIAIACWNPGWVFTDGLRLVTVKPTEHLDIDVPVVRVQQDVAVPLGGIGADIDPQSLVARLYRVRPGGPAAAAGLREGDVVIAVDGASVTALSPRGIRFLIASRPPGTTVKVTVRRGDETVTGGLVLGPPDEP